MLKSNNPNMKENKKKVFIWNFDQILMNNHKLVVILIK